MNPTSPIPRRYFLQSLGFAALGTIARPAGGQVKVPTVDEEIRRLVKDVALRMLFTGATPAELAAWQKAFAAEIERGIGPHAPPAQWRTELLSRAEFPDHIREELLLIAEGVPSLPLFLLKPARSRHGPGPFPIILALHGHGPFGHEAIAGVDDTPEKAENIRALNYDYGRQLVREGYVVAAPCFTPFGKRLDASYQGARGDPCATTFVRLTLMGQTLVGANLRDAQWALSHAQRLPEARPDRVGCVGLSLGGRMAMLTAALDHRIQAAVVSGALNVMQERVEGRYGAGCQAIPGLLEIGDTPEIGSLIAPRPCIWEIGSRDGLIKPEWAEKAKVRLRSAYAAAGRAGDLEFHHFEGGHEWSGKTAVPMLARVLKT